MRKLYKFSYFESYVYNQIKDKRVSAAVNSLCTVKGSRRRLFAELLILLIDARALKPAEVRQQLLWAHGLRSRDVYGSIFHWDTHQLVYWVYPAILACKQLLVPAVRIQRQQAAKVLGETVSGKMLAQLSHFHHLDLELKEKGRTR